MERRGWGEGGKKREKVAFEGRCEMGITLYRQLGGVAGQGGNPDQFTEK